MNDMNQPQVMSQSQQQMMSQPQNQAQAMNLSHSQVQVMSQPQMMNPPPQVMSQSQMLNLSYPLWRPKPPSMDSLSFPGGPMKPSFASASKLSKPGPGRSSWKGKKGGGNNNPKDMRRMEKSGATTGMNAGAVASGGGAGYRPPTLHELQSQNRLRARKFYPKKKFNNRTAPYAPRNTTSYIIRAKKSGGIASLVSPCPVTPAVLPTPMFSPSKELLVDTAKEEWGVDGYGSMKGLIRLRSPGHEADGHEDDDEEGGGSSESDVEEHVEVERRLDHDLSRFEMIYPNCGVEYNNILESRVDDQDTHIAQLEEENLTLKERLFLMENELRDLRRRMQCLERHDHVLEDINEEVVENCSENDSEGRDEYHTIVNNNEEIVESMPEIEVGEDVGVGSKDNNNEVKNDTAGNSSMENVTGVPDEAEAGVDGLKAEAVGGGNLKENIADDA